MLLLSPIFKEGLPISDPTKKRLPLYEKARGAIYTRREVANFILDLVGYVPEKPLTELRLLEPSFGAGDFLIPAIDRLLISWKQHSPGASATEALRHAIRAVELDPATYLQTRSVLEQRLHEFGILEAQGLARAWLLPGDFLTTHLEERFDFVVGNPPYVRQERIPAAQLQSYRQRFRTMFDRADLYVPFIERSLELLNRDGHLGFICADRWVKNRYGGPLRQYISEKFHLKNYVEIVGGGAFSSDVAAYPAIVVIEAASGSTTQFATIAASAQTSGSQSPLHTGYRGTPPTGARAKSRRPTPHEGDAPATNSSYTIEFTPGHAKDRHDVDSDGFSPVATPKMWQELTVVRDDRPWLFGKSERLKVVRRLEAEFPRIEAVGCRIGIGVATGADRIFIGRHEDLDVEPDRKLRLITPRDIRTGQVQWGGLGVINPFDDAGKLVRLQEYPRLDRYLDRHRGKVASRYIAKKDPTQWYRTIDRIHAPLTARPKLLIPDIKAQLHAVYESGSYYPHHNLYYITADTWDLRALQTVLRSPVARLFMESYSTKMRGEYLRFQAQYLRCLVLPEWYQVPDSVRATLIQAMDTGNREAGDHATYELYRLTDDECWQLKEGAHDLPRKSV